jgi:hypothetical protein
MWGVRPQQPSTPMPIDIPKEVAVCVKQLNGVVLDEVLKCPSFANADYWFREANVVAELKCLTENLSTNSTFNESLSALYASWVKRGLVAPPKAQRVKLNLRDLPARCAREFIDPIKKRLEASTIKKANRQIRETKKYLDAPTARGLLLLVNDGNYMLPPNVMAHLLARILKGQHSSISSVIYFSVNVDATVPGVSMPSQFWIDAIPPDREPVALEFRTALRTAWMSHHSSLVPGLLFEIEGSTKAEFIDNIQFTRGNAA